jgi:hypothetical protein
VTRRKSLPWGELVCRPSDGKFSTIRQHRARVAADFP